MANKWDDADEECRLDWLLRAKISEYFLGHALNQKWDELPSGIRRILGDEMRERDVCYMCGWRHCPGANCY